MTVISLESFGEVLEVSPLKKNNKKKIGGLESNHGAKEKKKKRIFKAQMCDLHRRPSGVTPYCAPPFRVGYLFATLSYLGTEPNTVGVVSEDLLPTRSAK